MIMQALCRYYEVLAQKGQAPLDGFAEAKCAFAAEIGVDGGLLGVVPLGEGKRPNRSMEVPRPFVKSSGVKSNFLCDTCKYVFGLDDGKKPERTQECANAFRAFQHEVLDGCDSDAARAMLAFVDAPRTEKDAAILSPVREDMLKGGGNIVFGFRGRYVHEDAAVRDAWLRWCARQADGRVMTCLITGEKLPVVIGHDKIKGVRNASTMGASLVAYNDYDAAYSFGLDHYENSPISAKASFAFTTALNSLLADSRHQSYLGDATVVYWAENAAEEAQDFFALLTQASADHDAELHDALEKVRAGRPVGELSLDVPFYVLALSPNAGRVSVRFFLRDSLGGLAEHLREHYDRLQIVHGPRDPEYLKPWQLLRELANQKSRDKQVPPPLAGSFLRALLTGGRYPEELLGAVMMRLRAEREVTYPKAALIKAYLMKNCEKAKEAINVALNRESDCKPYVLGRMFSILEQIQQAANPGINTTIKDRYFASACATPGVVFPQLLRLESAHMNKLDVGPQTYFGKLLGEVMNKLDVEQIPFPAQLSLEDQGLFFLGYYQQNQDRYVKKEDKGNV